MQRAVSRDLVSVPRPGFARAHSPIAMNTYWRGSGTHKSELVSNTSSGEDRGGVEGIDWHAHDAETSVSWFAAILGALSVLARVRHSGWHGLLYRTALQRGTCGCLELPAWLCSGSGFLSWVLCRNPKSRSAGLSILSVMSGCSLLSRLSGAASGYGVMVEAGSKPDPVPAMHAIGLIEQPSSGHAPALRPRPDALPKNACCHCVCIGPRVQSYQRCSSGLLQVDLRVAPRLVGWPAPILLWGLSRLRIRQLGCLPLSASTLLSRETSLGAATACVGILRARSIEVHAMYSSRFSPTMQSCQYRHFPHPQPIRRHRRPRRDPRPTKSCSSNGFKMEPSSQPPAHAHRDPSRMGICRNRHSLTLQV